LNAVDILASSLTLPTEVLAHTPIDTHTTRRCGLEYWRLERLLKANTSLLKANTSPPEPRREEEGGEGEGKSSSGSLFVPQALGLALRPCSKECKECVLTQLRPARDVMGGGGGVEVCEGVALSEALILVAVGHKSFD
jgi:hypothetical protein